MYHHFPCRHKFFTGEPEIVFLIVKCCQFGPMSRILDVFLFRCCSLCSNLASPKDHIFFSLVFRVSMKYHDSASLFMHILTRGASRNYLDPEDFIPLVQDVVDTHPGLVFLKQATEFHSRYILTVSIQITFHFKGSVALITESRFNA